MAILSRCLFFDDAYREAFTCYQSGLGGELNF